MDNNSKMTVTSPRKGLARLIYILILAVIFSHSPFLLCQSASTANWIYPDGNAEGTRYISKKSKDQDLSIFKIKWSTNAISGDVKPLIGNIISNPKIYSGFDFAPNEIIGIKGGRVTVVDATGKVHKLSDYMPYVNSISALFDTSSTVVGDNSSYMLAGIESLESETGDSLAFAYICGYNSAADTMEIMRRLAVDLRDFKPNVAASVKPFFGRKIGDNYNIYATLNMSLPNVSSSTNQVPYYRGVAQFQISNLKADYPLPDAKDFADSRMYLAPEVNFSQPSISLLGGTKSSLLLPNIPTVSLKDVSIDNINANSVTYADRPYVLYYDISGEVMNDAITPYDISNLVNGTRPQIRTYFVHINDVNSTDSCFILLAEEYKGRDGSFGTSKLHLLDSQGDPIPLNQNELISPIVGGKNHLWSVAVGNVDGNSSNSWGDYYPNNPGQEIIVTQSSRDFAYPASKLMILKYFSGSPIEKPTPPNAVLNPFDTICTQTINGWVAAVNDIDGKSDNKDEIFLVDGSTLRVLTMRDYNTFEFRSGKPFDTVFTCEFKNQTISSVEVADIEGDGLNDIIVTTQDSTYIIGSEMLNVISVLSPKVSTEYCLGDTVDLKWMNVIKSQAGINIIYQKVKDGVIYNSPLTIAANLKNQVDTSDFKIPVDTSLAGTSGYFIVEGAANPLKSRDSSAVITFNKPSVQVNYIPSWSNLRSGSTLTIAGTAYCMDSLVVDYSFDDTTWTNISKQKISGDGSFTETSTVPCPAIFNCSSKDIDSLMRVRIIAYKNSYTDTTNLFNLRILPSLFPLTFDSCTTGCPTRYFRWDKTQIKFDCTDIDVSISTGNGNTFTLIGTAKVDDQLFIWNIPNNLPDAVIIRFCCSSSCVRIDTMIQGYKPKYINIVAPNPFNPLKEQLDIIYTVPSDANVIIRIYDQANRIVAEPVKNVGRKQNVSYCDHWNGERADGSYVDNGMYYISIELSNGAKEVLPVYISK